MEYTYLPKNNLEKFGLKIYFLLVENSQRTYFVGGMVRDLLLNRPVTDVDLATAAKPQQIINELSRAGVKLDGSASSFGVIKAQSKDHKVEIASFRADVYGKSRYPKIKLVSTPKLDSYRRDFTVNSLYLSPKDKKIIDFHTGLADLKGRKIKLIGDAERRLREDPLRILRAVRLALVLNFRLEKNTYRAIQNNYELREKITKNRLAAETKKIKNADLREKFKKIISDKENLTLVG